jgi:hypothetical protein
MELKAHIIQAYLKTQLAKPINNLIVNNNIQVL